MSARSSLVRFLIQTGPVLAVLLTVGVLLAAIPAHRPPAVRDLAEQAQAPSNAQEMDHSKMAMSDENANEHAAVEQMNGHSDAKHLQMTALHPESPADTERAKEIVTELRSGIEKYKDYHVALGEGYRIFLPNLPQPEYHFTNYQKGFLEAFRFDPSQPTSLLYKKTSTGYELVGAMYTMPRRASEDQLDERVPLSVASWHLHTNLCMPRAGELKTADWTKFGLKGSISTAEACDAAGGRFKPVIFGWMVHVYPYESSLDKIFKMHHHD